MLQPPSMANLKAELQLLEREELVALCTRLARFRQDNKELLGYLLFEAHQPDDYTVRVKEAIDEGFAAVNTTNIWLAKKTIRKILRQVNKVARYAASKEMETALHLHFLQALHQLPDHIRKAPVMDKLARSERQKVGKLVNSLHEDLQYDFRKNLQNLDQTA